MNSRSYRWALILILLVFAVGAIVAYWHNHQRVAQIPTANNLAIYNNVKYGYAFYYPGDYTVRIAKDEDAIIGRAEPGFVTYAEARIATSSDAASYNDFEISAAKQLCAEQPGYTCTDVAQSSSYTSETNLTGKKLYLTMTAPDGTTQRFGPIYSFNIGGNVIDAKYASLLIYRPLGATGAVEQLPAEDIAGKVTITKVQSR